MLSFFFVTIIESTRHKAASLYKALVAICTNRRETPGHKKLMKKNNREGKEKKIYRTCLQGRLKIKRNTIPACIWVGASSPLPPPHTGGVTGNKCREGFVERAMNRPPSDCVLGSLFGLIGVFSCHDSDL